MKLLSYTFIRYLLFTALLLLISVPVSYTVLSRIFIHVIDNDLYQQANEIPTHQNHIQSERDLELWKVLDNDLEILPADSVIFQEEPFTEKRTTARDGNRQDFRILQKRIHILGTEYIVQIMSSLIEKEDLVRTIMLIQLSLFCLMLLGAAGINYFINKKVWKPFYESLAFLENFNLEKTAIAAPKKNGIKEFNQLNHSVHQLAVGVRNAYLSQKEFTENASHELQTPLAVLRSKVELLLQDKHLSEAQSMFIDDVHRVIDQLEMQNNDLLFLSKIENQQFTFTESFDIQSIVDQVVDKLSFMKEAKGQEINWHCNTNYVISGNRGLFKILVTNLLRNAIQHSPVNTVIYLKCDQDSFIIANPGSPLALKGQDIFNRFTKGESQKGAGLGLAIAQKIAAMHHMHIQYFFKDGKHVFSVKW